MKFLPLVFGLLFGGAAQAEDPIPAISSTPAEVASAPAVKPSAVKTPAPKAKAQLATPKAVHLAPSPAPKSPPVVQARTPRPVDLCRAGMALAKGRKIDEMTIQEEKGNVFTVSYVPWPNAPPDARTYKCKVVGNAIVSGETKGRAVKWNGDRVTWTLAPKVQELTAQIRYNTGKARSQTHTFWELENACNGCAGFQAAPISKGKAAATAMTKR